MGENSRVPASSGMNAGLVLAKRYAVTAPIHRGAMGTVYRALDRTSGEEVAVKHLNDLTQLRRFEIEARLLASLAHPRVVRVRDHFEDPRGYFLVMDLVRGNDLARVLDERGTPGLPVDVVLEYARQACEALAYVHEQRIVHRDVKPDNLILGDDGVVLVDFGVARKLPPEGTLHTLGTTGVGTPCYMAPEIFAQGEVSERSDVFSLAVTLLTLLCGTLPRYGDRQTLRELVPGVSAELSDAVRAGMAFRPEHRLATIEAFATALGCPLRRRQGSSLLHSVPEPEGRASLISSLVRTAAGVFDAAAASISLIDPATSELVIRAAWGAGADIVVGVRLKEGQGLSGSVATTGRPVLVADCRADPRFATRIAVNTGYVPVTMLIVPLKRGEQTLGVMSLLDRRDGGAYGGDDVTRATMLADLAVQALGLGGEIVSPP